MACALPVIGSDVGGIRYSVVDGSTGFLVPPRDPVALAMRLEQLRNDPALAEQFGESGMQRVRQRFTWNRISAELVDVYRAACRRATGDVLMPAATLPGPVGASLALPLSSAALGQMHDVAG